MLPIETTTGLPAACTASSSARICSAAKALPPGLSMRSTRALMLLS